MLIVWMTLLPSIFLSGFFFPLRGHAACAAVDLVYHPAALLPGHHPRAADQGGGDGGHLEGDPGAGCLRDCHHDRGLAPFPQTTGLI